MLYFYLTLVLTGYAVAQESSVDYVNNDNTSVIQNYQSRLLSVKEDLSDLASEFGDIVKCYKQKKLYTTSGCRSVTVLEPESDPFKANHAGYTIPINCASNEVQNYSSGSWECKEIRYLCSNPDGC